MIIQLDSPLDMHIHFREGDMLRRVAPLSARTFAGGVIMPNLTPPVDHEARLDAYEAAVRRAIGQERFEPYMTLFMRPYTYEELEGLRSRIIGVKLYPAGVTTNSDAGVKRLEEIEHTLHVMQELHIPLLVHGETEGFVMDRERDFMAVYDRFARAFPRLTIVMEHITTRDAVIMLNRYENIYATVTVQHLMITLNDVAGGLLDPHLFCKPIAKRPEDREALLETALQAHPKLMFGSDSAPHPVHKKECSGCAAGVFTAPIALQLLAELFERHHALENLQAFVSDHARRIYGIEPPRKQIHLEKKESVIPERYGEVVPIWAGKRIGWRVKEVID